MNATEQALVTGTPLPDSKSPLVNAIVGGSFRQCLVPPKLQLKATDGAISDLIDITADDELTRLLVAVSLLHSFVQANWTGPDLDFTLTDVLSLPPGDEDKAAVSAVLQAKAISELALGGEPAYHLCQFPVFFRFAQILLDRPFVKYKRSALWWRLRAHLIHQQILDEPVPLTDSQISLYLSLIDDIPSDNSSLKGRLFIELGRMYHLSLQDKMAKECLSQAAGATGLLYEVTGALGKRTKFQQSEHSQLVLLAQSKLSFSSSNVVPETLPLNDDTLLESIAFSSSNPSSKLAHLDPSSQPALHPLDQCILISLSQIIKSTSPDNNLTTEQVMPYVTRVLQNPQNWSVHTLALLLRSRAESDRTRTVERSVLQLQALLDQIPTSDSTIAERLQFFHSIPLPSKWALERELAERFLSIGVVKSAQEIFERLEMWEEVVRCDVSLERPEQGKKLVKDLLEGKRIESSTVISRLKSTHKPRLDRTREAKLWCLLGDLEPENAIRHYIHAWELSLHTSSRSMRSLGGIHFSKGEYQSAIDCLQNAVKINPLISKAWFIMGCAAVRIEDWETAKGAFARCVGLDDEDSESWNNLASVYIRLPSETASGPSNKHLAFQALKQSLKSSRSDWRVWQNYLIVAIDTGEFGEACRAMGQVVSLHGADGIDEEVLEKLVEAASGQEGEGRTLIHNIQNLFSQIVSQVSPSPRTLRSYARFLALQSKWGEALEAYMNAYRGGFAAKGDIDDIATFKLAAKEVEEVVDILRNYGPKSEVDENKWKYQARSVLRIFLAKTKEFEDEKDYDSLKEAADDLR